MSRWPVLLLALVSCGACHRPRMRADTDRAEGRRRCLLPMNGATREEQAVRCAEWFIARQGYTDAPPVADTQLVVSEGIEWAASIAERLAQRRGSLQPRAFGLCESPDGSFDVAFYMAGGQYARGVTMDARFGSLRVQHSNFDPAAIAERRHGCRPLSAARP